MLITLTDFWNYKFRNTSAAANASSEQLTAAATQFPGYLAITGNVPLALFVILTAALGYKVRQCMTERRLQIFIGLKYSNINL